MDWLIGIVGFVFGSCFGFVIAAILSMDDSPDEPDDPTYWWER